MTANVTIEDIGRSLHSSAIHLLRRVRTQDEALGVGPAQLLALSVVVFAGPISLNDLAKAELVKPPTMSRIIDARVKEGPVRRDVNKTVRPGNVIMAIVEVTRLLYAGISGMLK